MCKHDKKNAPGKSHRQGISLMELVKMFPDEKTARKWFEEQRWSEGRFCPRCGSASTKTVPNEKPMPYHCKDCRQYFSVKTGTAFERSKIPLQKWAIAIYLVVTSLKGVSSMKLHRDLKVTQKTAWFMYHRLREAWDVEQATLFEGPVEVDETFVGSHRKNMPKKKRKALNGRGVIGKMIVVGAKDRKTNRVSASVIESRERKTLHAFVKERTAEGSTVHTDEFLAYKKMTGINHQSVNHSVGEYVKGMAHTNGIESFWATLKRAHKGTFHKISKKHLQRYVNEFSGKHNARESDTIKQMGDVVAGMVGKRLMYNQLIA